MTAEKVLTTARSEIGTREQGVNHVKYVDEYLGTTSYDGNNWPWCVIFLWWVFRHSGDNGDLFPDTAHCDGVRAFAKSKGRWFAGGFKTGDIVIWDYNGDNSGDHIGIIESVKADGSIVTIEGNCGDMVARVTHSTGYISGIYRPEYSEGDDSGGVSEPAADSDSVYVPDITYPVVSDGYKGTYAYLLQAKLHIYGYAALCGEIDGEVGPNTTAAISAYQRDNELETDGICGPLTWDSLWKGGV